MRAFWLLLFASSFASAASERDSFSFSGFASLGALSSPSDELAFARDLNDNNPSSNSELNLSSLSVLGLQFNASLNEHFAAVVQVVARDSHTQSLDTILRIGTLNYTVNDQWQLRLGRSGPRIFLLNDTRLIGYSLPWTYPVQEFYAPLIVNHLDGIDSTFSQHLGEQTLKVNAFFGRSRLEFYDNNFGDAAIELKRAFGINLELENFDWLLRMSWATAEDGKNSEAIETTRQQLRGAAYVFSWSEGLRLAEDFNFENTKLNYYSVSGQYDAGSNVLQAEWGNIVSGAELVPSLRASYLHYGRHIKKFTPYLVLSEIKTRDDYSLQQNPPAALANITYGILGYLNTEFNQHGISLGLRWDFKINHALKIQWDRKYISRFGLWERVDNNPFPNDETEVDVISATWDLIF